MPNQLSVMVEQRIVAFALGHPGLGPRRVATRLARPEWGGLVVSANGVYKTLVRHGLNTRAKRLALVAGYRAPLEPPRESEPEPHIESDRPGELVGIDCFFVGRLHGAKGPVWQITAIDTYSSFAWADLVVCPPAGPTVEHTSALARRVAVELQAAGWQLERVRSDNGNEFGRRQFDQRLPAGVEHTQIRSGRPQTNGHVERLHRTILEECWRPAFARYLQVRYSGLQTPPRALPAHLQPRPRTPRTQHGRAMPGRPRLRCPQDGAEMSRTCRHNSESVQPRSAWSRHAAGRARGARASRGSPARPGRARAARR